MILKVLLLTDKYKLALEHNDNILYLRLLDRDTKGVDKIDVPNSFEQIKKGLKIYFPTLESFKKDFFNRCENESKYMYGQFGRKTFKVDLYSENQSTMEASLEEYQSELVEERGQDVQ